MLQRHIAVFLLSIKRKSWACLQKMTFRRSLFIETIWFLMHFKNFVIKILIFRWCWIHFVGKAAEDVGGPRREFFCLLIEQMFQLQDMFVGWPSNVVMKHNVEAVAANKYCVAGKILSTIMVQGAHVPLCFSDAVVDYLIFDKICSSPVIQDVANTFGRDCLTKVVTKINLFTF